MIVKHIPSPAEVGSRTTADGKEIKPDPNGPFVAQVFKATADPFVGRLTYFRVVSGTLAGQGHVYNANRKQEERVGNFLAVQGKDQENLAKVGPGRHRRRREADLDRGRRHARRRPIPGGRAAAHRLPGALAPGRDRAGVEGRSRQARPGAPPAAWRRSRRSGSIARTAPARRS